MNNSRVLTTFAIAGSLMAPASALAAVPDVINHEGLVLDNRGSRSPAQSV